MAQKTKIVIKNGLVKVKTKGGKIIEVLPGEVEGLEKAGVLQKMNTSAENRQNK